MWTLAKLKHVQQAAADLSIPTEKAFLTLRHGTSVALQTKGTEVSQNPQANRVANDTPRNTDMFCGV